MTHAPAAPSDASQNTFGSLANAESNAPGGPLRPALSAETAQAVSVSHPDEMKPNMTRRITVVIHDQTLLCYQAAARQLQRRLGEAAPSVEELIAYELTSKRTVKSIMDDYTDSQRRARR